MKIHVYAVYSQAGWHLGYVYQVERDSCIALGSAIKLYGARADLVTYEGSTNVSH